MSKTEKVPFEGIPLDACGSRIHVGSKVAYAVRKFDVAVLRIGVIEFIEAGEPSYWSADKRPSPIFYARFEGNASVSRCEKAENMVVLS